MTFLFIFSMTCLFLSSLYPIRMKMTSRITTRTPNTMIPWPTITSLTISFLSKYSAISYLMFGSSSSLKFEMLAATIRTY